MTDYRSRLFLARARHECWWGPPWSTWWWTAGRWATGGRELSWWSGAVLDVTVPIQQMRVRHALRGPGGRLGPLSWRWWRCATRTANLRQCDWPGARGRESSSCARPWWRAGAARAGSPPCGTSSRSPCCPRSWWAWTSPPGFARCCSPAVASHGIYAGMPVISEDGLVGLVTTTSSTRGQGEAAARPPERGGRRGAAQPRARHRARRPCTTSGSASRSWRAGATSRWATRSSRSGLGGVYPKGLRIGRVVEVPRARGGTCWSTGHRGARGGLRATRAGLRHAEARAHHGSALRLRRRRSAPDAGGIALKRALVPCSCPGRLLTPDAPGCAGLPGAARMLCPDLSLLVVLALALCAGAAPRAACWWRAASGFVADLAVGVASGPTRAAPHRDLRRRALRERARESEGGGLPQIDLRSGLDRRCYGVALGALTAFFSPGVGFGWIDARRARGAGAREQCAVRHRWCRRSWGRRWSRLGEDESGGRRVLRLETTEDLAS